MPPKLSNDRALRIVAAAREEFARRGFAGARVEQIARRAGVNKQLLFYYFHSKRGLFQAVLAQSAGELETALAGIGCRPSGCRRERSLAPALPFRRSGGPLRNGPPAGPGSPRHPAPPPDGRRVFSALPRADRRDRARYPWAESRS